jgi:outer membrane protein assembly factor BamB
MKKWEKAMFGARTAIKIIAAALLSLAGTTSALADDWRQFRGNDQTAAAPASSLPEKWNDASIAWKAELPGKAASSPIVVDGKVIVTSASGYRNDRLHVAAFDEATGKPLWHRQFWATGRTLTHPFSSVAANTPASDGEHIYAFFSSNDLACLDLDGNLVWFRGITHDYPAAANDVGMSASPVVVGDTVVVQVENEVDSIAMGLDKATGEELWKLDRPKTMNWTSPTVVGAGDDALVVLQSSDYLTAHHPRTGKEAWRFAKGCSTIVSPVAIGESVYACSGDGMVKLVRKGTTDEVDVVWSQAKLTPSNASPVVSDGIVYTINRAGVLVAANVADGEILWQTRLKGPFWATPVLAGDKLFVFNHEGLCQVVQLGDDGKVIAENQLEDKVLGSPAVVGNAMFVRSEKFVWKIAGGK